MINRIRIIFWFVIFGGGTYVGWKLQDFLQPPAEYGLTEELAIIGCCGLGAVLVSYGLIQSFT